LFDYSGDIIIERWVPYGPQPQRRTIVQRAAAAVQYPQPRNIIVVYDTVLARVIRQFQRFGITQEDPQAYVARYGASLLDAATLVQQARTAGVIEDIVNIFSQTLLEKEYFVVFQSPPVLPSSTQFSSSASFYTSGGEVANSGNTNYSSSSSFAGDSALASSVGVSSTGFSINGPSFTAADTNRDGRLDQAEFQQFVQSSI
jgi:hypothetical protein